MIDPRQLCQFEVKCSNLELSCQFYQEVFGWKRAPAEFYRYAVLEVPEDCPFGLALIEDVPVTNPESHQIPLKGRQGILAYFAVPNLANVEINAASFGVSIGPQRNIPGLGIAVTISDPDGNQWGLFVSSAIAEC